MVTEAPRRPDVEPRDLNGGEGSAASILAEMHKRKEGALPSGPDLHEALGSFGKAWREFRGPRHPEEVRTIDIPTAQQLTNGKSSPIREEVFRTEEELVDNTEGLPVGAFLSPTTQTIENQNPSAEQQLQELTDHGLEKPKQRDVRAEMINFTRSTIDGDLEEYRTRCQESLSLAEDIILTMITNNAPFNLLAQWKEIITQARAMALGGLYLSGGLVKGEGNHTEPFVDRDIALEYAGAHTQFEDLQEKLDELQRSTTRIVEDYVRDHPSSRFLFGAHPEKILRANPAHLRGPIDPYRADPPFLSATNKPTRNADNPREIRFYRNWHGENNLPEQPRKPKPKFFRRGQLKAATRNLVNFLTNSKDPAYLDS